MSSNRLWAQVTFAARCEYAALYPEAGESVLPDGSQLRGFLKQNPTADVIVIVERWNTAPELKAAILGLRLKTTHSCSCAN